MAAALERSFIEICGFERETASRSQHRDVTVNLGLSAFAGGLKFPDNAGAFHYKESAKPTSVTSNRFIHWSTSGDTLQLMEKSLDANLLNNSVKLHFTHCLLLPGGVTIHETPNNVIILIATTQSVHRFLLPHPARMYRSDLVTEMHMQSIFTDVGKISLHDPSNSIAIPNLISHTGVPSTAAAWLGDLGEAHFALALATGGITVVTVPTAHTQGGVSVVELKRSSVMQRLSGWMPSAIRGEQNPADVAVNIAVREVEDDSFIFALCQDHKLRMWSLSAQVCLLESDMLQHMPACKGVKRGSGHGHRLRLFYSPSIGLLVAVYLAVPQRGQFVVLQLSVTDNNRYFLDPLSSQFCIQETLVDFTLTATDIWALWLDDSNTTIVKNINFDHNSAGQWTQVFVQPPPEEEVPIRVDQDPRETYLDVLFSPLSFTTSAIVKALQIFRRGSDVTDCSWENLKKEVTIAVENELQSSLTEFEFSQDEYRQLQVEFWSKFYACCLQYQEALATPLALSVNSHNGMACLLKKGFVSFLLPCFAVDHLYFSCAEYLTSEEEMMLTDDSDLNRDILQLVQCMRLVNGAVSSEMAYEMKKCLEQVDSPEKTADLILENITISNDSENVIEEIQNKLQVVRNPGAAMMVLLRELDLETETELGGDTSVVPGRMVPHLYSSSTAASIISQTVGHISMTRELLCRDLLILLKLSLYLGDNVFLGGGMQLLQLQQDLVPRCSQLLSSYHLLVHVSQSMTSAVALDAIDANLQHLSVLQLSDSPSINIAPSALTPQTLVEHFYLNVARKIIVLSQLESPPAGGGLLQWTNTISNTVNLLSQLLWPSNAGFQFPECLMANCQFSQLQEYVRLTSSWCQVNIGSCRFMLGQCYLANGEGHKAVQCFQEASSEVEKEEFLMRLTGGEEDETPSTPRLQYFNKTLRLLEDVGLPEQVIQLAFLVLTEATDTASQAALWTRIFKHHLDLGHNSQAYEALIQNPDSSMQLDCLRQLVVVLCERSQLQDLVQFSYVNLHDEVVSIIESRARCLDLLSHNYYELLYAFHINRHNYRKAGTVMFELGMRLGREVPTLLGLQKQVNCYLAALNCLRLIRPEYAWIVQPASGAVYKRPGMSPKRDADGELTCEPVKRQVDILEIKDLEKEYMLARSRLTLARHHPPSAAIAGGASAEEMVALLTQTGLLDSALSLCQTFKLPLEPVFEGLAFKCVKLQFGGEKCQNEAWSWLAANQLSSVVNTKESSATDEAWRLLSSYLDKYPSHNGSHHRCVVRKLLSHGAPLPDWLIQSYKAVDAAALLRLYLNYDLLEDAADLVMEYVDALLGKGHQYFGIESPLTATSAVATVWLPYTSIDQLLQALHETDTSAEIYHKVQAKLSHYHRVLDQTTRRRLAIR
ncbi:nuclear pore complex protein Nup160 [Synchiropus splendidus]|uniref:nuclear pore complex protein Nup160 n=1 Tax=Synchiropus splendidus TaxID=270530 RepID=UPI00237D7D51|nr:nuclear pore complex protein Nup160 [Synchiropus splendidus]